MILHNIYNRYICELLLVDIFFIYLISVDQWSPIKLGGTFILWSLFVCFYFCLEVRNRINLFATPYEIVGLYLLWAFICILRGFFVASNYWEFKNLIHTSLILLMPYCVYAFSSPSLLSRILRNYFYWGLIAFVLWIYWMVGFSQFYLGPVYMIIPFLSLIRIKWWKLFLFFLVLGLLLNNPIEQRSQSLKALAALLLMLACILRKYYSPKILKIALWSFFIAPILFIILGISGVYNVFSATNESYGGRYVLRSVGENSKLDITDDTRTFLYYEIISSAVNNEYVLFGRTPARGNDTNVGLFLDEVDAQNKKHHVLNIKRERQINEFCFPNFLTWTGLVGMTLYCLIYIMGAYYGFYKSNSFYVKVIALFVAFNFSFGWVENCSRLDIENITYWFMISICFSSKFREMSDIEFKIWFNSIFKFKKKKYESSLVGFRLRKV